MVPPGTSLITGCTSGPSLGEANEDKPIACWEVLWRKEQNLVPGEVWYRLPSSMEEQSREDRGCIIIRMVKLGNCLLNNLAGVHNSNLRSNLYSWVQGRG